MTREDRLLIETCKGMKYSYYELMNTFLAGSRMNSNHYESWMQAFEEWIIHLQSTKDALGLS